MADYDNNMRGVLFPNDKGDNPKRPDMKGSLEIDGTKYFVSAWNKTSQKGQDFISFVVEEDDGVRKNAAPASNGATSQSLSDEIPF